MPVGSVMAYAGKTAPTGWLLCDGKPIPAGNEYSELKTVLGDSNTPNLSGRMVMGAQTNYVMNSDGSQPNLGFLPAKNLGEMAGDSVHTLAENEIPSHGHNASNNGGAKFMAGYVNSPSNVNVVDNGGGFSAGGGSWAPSGFTVCTDVTGGGAHHNNMPPYTTLNYIIKY